MTASVITVGELQKMLQGIDGGAKIKMIVMDDLHKEIKMVGLMDYIIKPTDKDDPVIFYGGGEAKVSG